MELLKELMNRGYLIFDSSGPKSTDQHFTVRKVSTPCDSLTYLDTYEDKPEGVFNTSVKYFDSYEQSLDFCKKEIDWKEESPPEAQLIQQADSVFKMELMYRHRGLGLKFSDLGELANVEYAVAKEEARIRGEKFIKEIVGEKDVDGWEVKVQPCVKK